MYCQEDRPFFIGKLYDMGSSLKRHADDYAANNNFVISVDNSLYFKKEDIEQAQQQGRTLPSDNMKYIKLICSRGGAPKKQKQKETSADECSAANTSKRRTRRRTSEKCGCKWVVSGSWNLDVISFKVVSAFIEHTDGCDPTPAQQRVMLRKKTRGKVERLAPAVLNSIQEMMADKFPLFLIRKRIRNKVPVTLLTDAVFFRNLKLKFERQRQKGLLPTIPDSATAEDNPFEEVPSLLSCVSVSSATRSLIAPTLAFEGVKIIYILQKLRAEVPGFEYRIYIDENTKQLAGWVYMTPQQRAALKRCGQVMFVDSKKMWPSNVC